MASDGSAAPRPRNQEHLSRRFLARAYQRHTTVGLLRPQGVIAFQISLSNLSPAIDERATAIQIGLFDGERRRFLGPRERIEVEQVSLQRRISFGADYVFLCPVPPGKHKIVVEAMEWGTSEEAGTNEGAVATTTHNEGEVEQVFAWGTVDVNHDPNTQEITLVRGRSQLLLLDEAQWPTEPLPTEGTIAVRLVTRSLEYQAALARLIPPACLAPVTFLESAASATAQKSFKVSFENLKFTLSAGLSAADVLPAQSVWNAVVFGHNGYLQLTPPEEVQELSLTVNADGSGLEGVGTVELSNLPIHASTSVVICLRSKLRGESGLRTRGVAVIPLVMGGTVNLRDCDMSMVNLPVLRGPFSGPDTRTLATESRYPYANTGLLLSVEVAYDSTLNPASEVIEVIDQRGNTISSTLRPQVSASQPAEKAPRERTPKVRHEGPVAPSTESAGGRDRQVVEAEVVHESRLTPRVPPLGVSGGAAAGHGEQLDSGSRILELHTMLCAIAEEVRLVHQLLDGDRQNQNRGRQEISNTRRGEELSGSHGGSLGPDRLFGGSVELVDLAMKRLAISGHLRAKLNEAIVPVLHPISKSQLSDAAPPSGILPLTQLGIRVDGITIPMLARDDFVPQSLYATVQAGFGGVRQSGSLAMRLMGTDPAVGKTHHLSGQHGAESVIWVDDVPSSPLSPERESLMKQLRSNGVLFLQLFDSATAFYYGSCVVPLGRFHRPPTSPHTITSFDAALFFDTTIGSLSPDVSVFPLLTACGQLHLSLVAVGHPRPPSRERDPDDDHRIAADATGHTKSISVGGNGGRELRPRKLEGPNVVFVPKLSDAELGLPAEPAAQTTSSGAGLETANTAGSDTKPTSSSFSAHAQRALFVKNLLRQNGGMAPPGGVVGGGGSALMESAELEYKLSYVQKKKDELRSQKIAEHLRRMVTTEVRVCVVHGKPELIRVAFSNPYPHSAQFSLEVDPKSVDSISLQSAQPKAIVLGPHEATQLVFVARYNGAAGTRVGAEGAPSSSAVSEAICTVFTDRMEQCRIVKVLMECLPAVPTRNVDVFGPVGQPQRKAFFSRSFTPTTLLQPVDVASGAALHDAARGLDPLSVGEDLGTLSSKIGHLCRYPVVTDPAVVVDTDACVDPLTQDRVAAWEIVTISASMPQRGERPRTCFVFLYSDPALEVLCETWEVRISACVALETETVRFGQTSQVNIPIRCDQCYSSASNITVAKVTGSTSSPSPSFVTLKVKPRGQGQQTVLLHARIGDLVERYVVRIPTTLPTPTYVANIAVGNSELGAPIFRRLTFVNQGLEQMGYRVNHNYHQHVHITPLVFALGPQGTQQLAIRIDGLHSGPRGSVVRYPVWVFVNSSSNDQTVDSYLLDVQVGGGPVPISAA